MGHLMKIALFGLVSGVLGTGIGGLMAFFVNKVSGRTLGFLLEFSSGLMTSVVCFELIPEAFEVGGISVTFFGIVTGMATILAIEGFIGKTGLLRESRGDSGLLKAGLLVAVGIAMHNLPEGFAVGSGFEASLRLGLTITAVIVIHDVPEGIAMAVPMRAGGFSKTRAFLLTVLSGVPMGIGALAGAALGEVSRSLTAVCLGFAGGAMLYIVFGELIPESKRLYMGRFSSAGNIMGFLCGIIVAAIGGQ